MNNDIDCLHESCIVDVNTAYDEMVRRGAQKRSCCSATRAVGH